MGIVEKIIDFSARNKFMVFLGTLLFLAWGAWAVRRMPLDALPDLSDTQVIISTEWMGRSPNLIEDQVTYPLVTTFLAAPHVKLVRGFTMFGMSFVYVVFEDGTDVYWARSRVLEYLSKLQGKLPPGVTPQMGPDATGVGWVFEYALVSRCEGKANRRSARRSKSCAASRTGTSATSCRRFPAWPRSRAWAATKSSTRSRSIPRASKPTNCPYRTLLPP